MSDGAGFAAARIIPALAGNTPGCSVSRPGKGDHPRSRGEYRPSRARGKHTAGSSPLSRGILDGRLGQFQTVRIIPALAGNTSYAAPIAAAGQDHPRSRGEYCLGGHGEFLRFGSSPLSRGIPTCATMWRPWSRIIPALAGNTWRGEGRRRGDADHPRSRGEYMNSGPSLKTRQGSSPLSRGIRRRGIDAAAVGGIIPALAGNTPPWWGKQGPRTDHPRSRGEYSRVLPMNSRTWGSSPLSRGILGLRGHGDAASGIIPALAGNTPSATPTTPTPRDHPRSRGEYKARRMLAEGLEGSSPLSRGIPPPLPAPTTPVPDHPRSRGEYVREYMERCGHHGSSPLSRGIPGRVR